MWIRAIRARSFGATFAPAAATSLFISVFSRSKKAAFSPSTFSASSTSPVVTATIRQSMRIFSPTTVKDPLTRCVAPASLPILTAVALSISARRCNFSSAWTSLNRSRSTTVNAADSGQIRGDHRLQPLAQAVEIPPSALRP